MRDFLCGKTTNDRKCVLHECCKISFKHFAQKKVEVCSQACFVFNLSPLSPPQTFGSNTTPQEYHLWCTSLNFHNKTCWSESTVLMVRPDLFMSFRLRFFLLLLRNIVQWQQPQRHYSNFHGCLTKMTPRPIQSISCNVRLFVVCWPTLLPREQNLPGLW